MAKKSLPIHPERAAAIWRVLAFIRRGGQRQLSQEEVGERADVAQQSVGAMLSGRRAIGPDVAHRVADKTRLVHIEERYLLAPEVAAWNPPQDLLDLVKDPQLAAALRSRGAPPDGSESTDPVGALSGGVPVQTSDESRRLISDLFGLLVKEGACSLEEAQGGMRAVAWFYDQRLDGLELTDLRRMAYSVIELSRQCRRISPPATPAGVIALSKRR